jgi:hypothetical protein
MEGLLVSSQVSVAPMLIGVVTGLVIFMQTVGDIFGIAIFAAVYQNELRSKLSQLALTPAQITTILVDVQHVKANFNGSLRGQIVETYAKSLQNGWWLMFACAAALLISALCAKQHKFSS